MHTALVKFLKDTMPVVFGIGNTEYGKNLATMENVEWVQVITPMGYVCRYDNGAAYPDNIAPIPGKIEVPHVCEKIFTGNVTPEKLAKIVSYLRQGKKIQALKVYREVTGLGLKESKEFVDELDTHIHESCPATIGCFHEPLADWERDLLDRRPPF